jgi:hypothetical protein
MKENLATMKRFAVCLLVVSILAAQAASAENIRCRFDTAPAPGYIAPEITLEVLEAGDVIVKDAVISSTGRERVIGAVSKDDGRRLSVVWEIKGVPPSPFETRAYDLNFLVRLSVQKADGAARITVVDLLVREKEYRSAGTCRLSP